MMIMTAWIKIVSIISPIVTPTTSVVTTSSITIVVITIRNILIGITIIASLEKNNFNKIYK